MKNLNDLIEELSIPIKKELDKIEDEKIKKIALILTITMLTKKITKIWIEELKKRKEELKNDKQK